MKGFFFLLFLVSMSFIFAREKRIEPDAALTIIINDTIVSQTPYTRIFKVSNKHPSLGEMNIPVSYDVKKNGAIVARNTFTKRVNRYTTKDTGHLFLNESGRYQLCGRIQLNDADDTNNKACKIITVVDKPYDKPRVAFFSLGVVQNSSHATFLDTNASNNFTLIVQKGKKTLLAVSLSNHLGKYDLHFIPPRDGLYTVTAQPDGGKKQQYSVFLSAPAKSVHEKNATSNNAIFNKRTQQNQQVFPLYLALFFLPLFMLAAYIIIKK